MPTTIYYHSKNEPETIEGTAAKPAVKVLAEDSLTRQVLIDMGESALFIDSSPEPYGGGFRTRSFNLTKDDPSITRKKNDIYFPHFVKEIEFKRGPGKEG